MTIKFQKEVEGFGKSCILWQGNIGYCEKHDTIYVIECHECATDHYYDYLNEQEAGE